MGGVWFLPSVPVWFIVLLTILYIFYKYFTWNFGVFKKLGIKGPTPYPMFGTLLPFMSKGLAAFDLELKKKYGKVVGTFQGRIPMLMIYDLDMIKQILIKDFGNFSNRFFQTFGDPILDLGVFALEDDHWKHVRSILTPTFSSGKLRKMNTRINQCSETLCNNLEKKVVSNETFDLKDYCGAYVMDVIACTSFGMEIDSHNDPKNQFVQMGKKAFEFPLLSPKAIVAFFFPFLIKPLSRFGLSIIPKDVTEFFMSVVKRALDGRENEQKVETDFLQIMVNAHLEEEDIEDTDIVKESRDESGGSWKKKGLTHDEVIAQGFFFFIAGYETTTNAMSFLGYNLARHQDVQDRVYKEIMEFTEGQETVTSDLVQKMPYLDMCISETLRMYPGGPRTDRVAKNDVTVNGVFIPKGMAIGISITALHNDPDLWEEPEKFNPDRFLPEAKEKMNPMQYMPFSAGPRHCAGMRLALIEIKISMVHVLRKFKLVTCDETEIPLKLDKMAMRSANGIKIKVESRH